MGMFANRFKSLRLKHDLSQQELADELNISKSSVSMYERGQREPDFETLEMIADFFNVDMNYLIGYSDDPHDWERIGNEAGIHPPKDYDGSYEDYVKFKIYEEQDALIDSYYDSHPGEDINEDYKNIDPDIRRIEHHGKERELLEIYKQLSDEYKNKTLQYSRGLLSVQQMDTELQLNAAHARTDIEIPEGTDTSDDDIMDDENF